MSWNESKKDQILGFKCKNKEKGFGWEHSVSELRQVDRHAS